MKPVDRAKFRVKIKSLAVEAKFIRIEEKRAARGPDCNELHLHRVGVLRSESRSTLLAYAYGRGVPYCAVESCARVPDHKRIAAILRSLTYAEVRPDEIVSWMKKTPCEV